MMTLRYPASEDLTTLVMISMPPEVQRVAIPIMSQYNRQMRQWNTAHLTLFFPFVSFHELPNACNKLTELCKGIAPFQVTLDGYGYWPNGVYLRLKDPSPVQRVFNTLFAHFPEYPPYGGKYGNELDPHVTIGHFDDTAETKVAVLPEYSPVTFVVDRLHVMYGSDVPIPISTYDVIPLRT